MRALIIEDNREQADFIRCGLAGMGCEADIAATGDEGLRMLEDESAGYRFAVVDLMLPGLNGLEIIRRVRARGNKMPLIILSSQDSVAHKISGLNIGADDYLTKPFSMDELTARISALLRRLSSDVNMGGSLKYDDIVLDRESHRVMRAGRKIDLTRLEYLLLEYLMSHPKRIIPVSVILEQVWQASPQMDTRAVESRVWSLRKKMTENGAHDVIRNVRGLGYGIG